MDIRSFFKKPSQQSSSSTKNSQSSQKSPKNKTSKKKENEKSNVKNEKKKDNKTKTEKNKEDVKKREKKQIEEDETQIEPVVKKKRLLKKKIISDSDTDLSETNTELFNNDDVKEEENKEKEENVTEKPNNMSVRIWVMEEMKLKDPEKVEELEKDKCSTDNMQTDIQNWCNNEKKLVDLSKKVKKNENVNIDMGSYLDSMCGPKSHKESKTSLGDELLSVSVNDPKNQIIKSFKQVFDSGNYSTELKEEKVSEEKPTKVKKQKEKVDTRKLASTLYVKMYEYTDANNNKEKQENEGTPKRLVKEGSPRRTTKTVEVQKPEPVENLFDSSDSPSTSSSSSASDSQTIEMRIRSKVVDDSQSPLKKRKVVSKAPKKDETPFKIDDPVAGKKFVFTGELSMDRDEATYRVKKLGGLVVSAVSGVTDYLVYGEKLEDGRPFSTGVKYKKAKELNKNKGLNIQLINEDQFMALLSSSAMSLDSSRTDAGTKENGKTSKDSSRVHKHVKRDVSDTSTTPMRPNETMLFEKYRPRRLSDLIGNPKLIDRLKDWLENYDYMPTKDKGAKSDNFKAALLSGPPGIGKTTCARLVAESYGYYVMEFNASDQRSKNAVERITPLVTGTVTMNAFQNNQDRDMRRTVLVLDEIDGMSSGDRGGIQSIIKLIQVARCPIILICNDRYCQKINTVANRCLDLRFNSPSVDKFISRVNEICELEGISASENLILELYHRSNGDMRYTLNYLQFYTPTNTDEGKDGYMTKKDETYSQNIFDNCAKIFNLKLTKYTDKVNKINEIFFSSYSIMPLMLQENYLKYLNNTTLASKISLLYVYGDMLYSILQRNQSYSLMPDFCTLSAVLPAFEIEKSGGTQKERLSFPQWLGKYATTNKNRRILGEISMNLSDKTTIYGCNLLMDGYLEIIYKNVIELLLDNNVDGCADYINGLGLTRDLVIDGIVNIRFKNQENVYSKINTKIKTQLTKKMAMQLVKVVSSKKSQFSSFDTKNENESDYEEKSEVEDDKDPLLKKVSVGKKQRFQRKK